MIALGETNPDAAEIPFYLPLASNPVFEGLTDHDFSDNATSTNEVEIMLPGGDWFYVNGGQIVEKGNGWYAVQLTESQCSVAGTAYIRVVIIGNTAQPYSDSEEIGLYGGGDIDINGSFDFVFFMPDPTNPIFGPPVTGHTFTLGEVQYYLPGGDAFVDASLDDISEVGNGFYKFTGHGTVTQNRGKVYVYAAPSGTQPYGSYFTVLNTPLTLPPTINIVSPLAGSTIGQSTKIIFQYIDTVPLRRAMPCIKILQPDGVSWKYELIHDGVNFTPDYIGTLTYVSDTVTQFAVQRKGGWGANLTYAGVQPGTSFQMVPFGVDDAGNESN